MKGSSTGFESKTPDELFGEGMTRALAGDLQGVVDLYTYLFESDPKNRLYREVFIDTLSSVRINKFDDSPKALFQICLDDEKLNLVLHGGRWLRMLQADPHLGPFYEALNQVDYESFKKAFEDLKDHSPLKDPFFVSGIENLIVSVPAFENFMRRLRRLMLEDLDHDKKLLPLKDYIALCEALAIYCFETDYIFFVTPEEKKAVADLKHYVDSMGADADAAALCILACYEPLAQLEKAEEIGENLKNSAVKDLVHRQILDVLERKKIRDDIPSLTPIKNNTSYKVQKQYEVFPYPRWRGLNMATIAYQNEQGHRPDGEGTKLLVAGCGTGWEVAEIACAFPKADILAIDLSLESLSYAQQRTKKFGLDHITFKQADILQLKDHKEQYDYIACSGVLHHMEDPVQGWKILTDLLKPGCTMRLGLYATNARESIIKAQKMIKKNKIGADIESIRRFRMQAPQAMTPKMYQDITLIRDYYVAAECCDLLFHVKEHQFTLPRIKTVLEFLDLNFIGFFLPPRTQEDYLKQFPEDNTGVNLDNWIAYEQQNPDTFVEMYRFWCQKKPDTNE